MVSEITQLKHFLLITSKPGTESSQVFICCERQIYMESKSIKYALLDLLSTYFIFDLVYPKTFCCFCSITYLIFLINRHPHQLLKHWCDKFREGCNVTPKGSSTKMVHTTPQKVLQEHHYFNSIYMQIYIYIYICICIYICIYIYIYIYTQCW